MKKNLQCFNPANVMAIYNLITTPGKRNRTEIATETNLSLPTAIKITDEFLKLGLIKSHTVTSGNRKVKYVALHPEKYCVVYDFSTPHFKSLIINLSGELIHELTFPEFTYGPYRMIDELADLHIKNTVSFLKSNFKSCHCFGEGFLTPGRFDYSKIKVISPRYPQINRLDFSNIVKANTINTDPVFCDIRECYAQRISALTAYGGASLIIFFDLNDISTSYVANGVLNPQKYAPFGEAVIRNGHTLQSICRDIADPHVVAPIFADEIFEISKKIPIDNVFIVGNRYSPMRLFSTLVCKNFEKFKAPHRTYLPRIRFDIDRSAYFTEISAKIRDMHYLE